jgi:hypothetical protein
MAQFSEEPLEEPMFDIVLTFVITFFICCIPGWFILGGGGEFVQRKF